jgi:hypothetical protein
MCVCVCVCVNLMCATHMCMAGRLASARRYGERGAEGSGGVDERKR